MMKTKGRRAFGLAAFFFCAFAHAQPAADKLRLCESCHGAGGNSTTEAIPSIAAQPVTFLENQLVYFREDLRNAPVMQGIAKGMKDEDITALARHFSAQKARVLATAPADKALQGRGAALIEKNHCGQCHLDKLQGQNQMPRLAGQREDYLLPTMIAYRDGKRTGADTTMIEVLSGFKDEDLKALAHYIARLE